MHLLAGVKFPVYRYRTGKIRTIIHIILCSGIRQHHTSQLQDLAMIVIILDVHDMEDLGQIYVGYDEEIRPVNQFGTSSLRMGRRLQPGFVG